MPTSRSWSRIVTSDGLHVLESLTGLHGILVVTLSQVRIVISMSLSYVGIDELFYADLVP